MALHYVLACSTNITNVTRCCHYHIRALRHIRPLLDTAETIAASIVGSRLDYCNSLLYGVRRLHHAQNVLARVVAQAPSTIRPSAADIRRDLHWLPTRLLTIVLAIKLACLPGKHCILLNHSTCLSQSLLTFQRELYVPPTRIFYQYQRVLQVTSPHALFLFPHRQPGTLYLNIFAL